MGIYILITYVFFIIINFLLFKTYRAIKLDSIVTNPEQYTQLAFNLRILFIVNILVILALISLGFIYVFKSLNASIKVGKILQSYRQSKQFLNALTEGIIVQNIKGYIIECNSAAENILGLSIKQMRNESFVDPFRNTIHEDGSLFPNEEHPAMIVLQTGQSQENIIMGVNKPSGELTWMLINSHPVRGSESDNLYSVVSTFTDITNEKIKDDLLRKNEERLRMAIDKTGDNAWEHNFQTGVTWFSSANNNFLGYTAEELIEKENEDKWWSNTHPEDKHLLTQNDKEYKAGNRQNHSIEYRIFHKDGTMKWVLDRGVVIEKDEKGLPIRIIGTHTDISKEKNLQYQLVKQEQQKKKDIIEAIIQAQEKEREEIAYELHEEVNQVLSSVKLLLSNTDGEKDDLIKTRHIALERVTDIIDEIRKISKNINTSTLKLLGLVTAMNDVLISAQYKELVHLKFEHEGFNETLSIDFPIQISLFRIFQEVIKNITCQTTASEVKITLLTLDDTVELIINDNGNGFIKDSEEYINTFRNIINRTEQYQGKAIIDSTPGKGYHMEIIFPTSVTPPN